MISEPSNIDKLKSKKVVVLIYLNGKNDKGLNEFYYMAVKGDNMLRLNQRLKNLQGSFEPRDYGTVLTWGVGEPSKDIQKQMEEKYGFNHAMRHKLIENSSAA